MKPYYLDSNVLIEVKNRAYAFDIARPFWDWLEEKLFEKIILLSKLIYDELTEGDDDLSNWIKKFNHTDTVVIPNEDIQKKYQRIADYVMQTYPVHQVHSFLKRADAWVIAHAYAQDAIVITHEALVDNTSKRIKIPNICKHFDVSYDNLYKMMRDLGFSFNSLGRNSR